MQISSLRIDRFGVWSDLKLTAFSDGLNVIYGPNGSGKTTLVQFIRTMLYGFDDQVRQRYQAADARSLGGSLTVQGRFGQQTLQRHDTGDRDGRLVVEDEHGSPLALHQVQDLLGAVLPTVFDHVFLAGFHGWSKIDRLIEEALAQGFDLLGSQADLQQSRDLQEQLAADRRLLAEVPVPEVPLPELLNRRYRLQQEWEALQRTLLEQQGDLDGRMHKLSVEISELEDELEELHHELDAVETDLVARQTEQSCLEESLRELQQRHEKLAGQRREKLRELDAQLDRWRGVLRDLEARTHRLLEEPGEVEASRGSGSGAPRHLLRRMELRLDELQRSVLATNGEVPAVGCQCRTLRETLRNTLPALREDIYRLCNEFSHGELVAQRVECSTELGQLRRCEAELRQAIQTLTRRREELLAETTGRQPAEQVALEASHGPLCQCVAHPTLEETQPSASPAPEQGEELLAKLQTEVLRLSRRRQEVRADIESLEDEARELREHRHRLQADGTRDAEQADVRSQQQELDRALQQIRDSEKHQQLVAAVAQGETELRLLEANVRDSAVLREASDLLRRLTDGDLQQVSLTRARAIFAQNRQGDRLAYDQLSSGGRDQVYLSLCLALAAAYGRQGTRLPLILNDAFLNIDAKGTAAAALLLRDFGQRGHQVLLFTRHIHVADLFREQGDSVRQLPTVTPREMVVKTASAPELSEQQRTEINNVLNAIAAEIVTPHEPVDQRVWSSEEFPGELTDRVRLKKTVEPSVPAVVLDDELASEYFLLENSPIQDAPSIDSATAERLRKIGVLQVRDLLRLKPAEAAAQLRYAGITAAMIERWQAEAALACRVAQLRPYDARILVACGITDADQLAQIEAEELLRRVETFSATSLGQVLLRAGNRYELSRLTDWIRTARRLHPGRHAHRESTPPRPQTTDASRPRPPRSNRDSLSRSRRPDRERDALSPRPQARPETTPVVLKMEPVATDGRFHLEPTDAVEAAPSIGPRLAERFTKIGIPTVADFLRADAEQAAQRLGHRRVTVDVIRQWQQQTTLVCRIPELRGHDAQILVACGVTEPEQLAKLDPAELWKKVQPFADSTEGKRIIRGSAAPDVEEVGNWIRWAAQARTLRAA